MTSRARNRYVSVVAVEVFVVGSMLLAYKIAISRWGSEGFGEYLLARRAISLVQLPLLVGLGLSISRYVAMTRPGDTAPGPAGREREILVAGLFLASLAALPALGVLWLLRSAVAGFVYGGPGYERYVAPVIVGVAGLIVYAIAYAYACGRLEMRLANFLKVVNLGIVPLVAVAWPGLTAAGAVAATGTAWLVLSVGALAAELGILANGIDLRRSVGSARELLRYGLPRVPGEFALVGLFSLPTVLVAHAEGVMAAGQIGFAIALLSGVGVLLAPTGVVLLPTASRLLHAGKRVEMWAHVKQLLVVGMIVAAIVAGLLELVAGRILTLMFGDAGMSALPIARVVLLGTLPYSVYLLLRNLLDAMEVRAVNTKNLMWALAAATVIGYGAQSAVGVGWGLVIGLFILGLLTAREARAAFERLTSE